MIFLNLSFILTIIVVTLKETLAYSKFGYILSRTAKAYRMKELYAIGKKTTEIFTLQVKVNIIQGKMYDHLLIVKSNQLLHPP